MDGKIVVLSACVHEGAPPPIWRPSLQEEGGVEKNFPAVCLTFVRWLSPSTWMRACLSVGSTVTSRPDYHQQPTK